MAIDYEAREWKDGASGGTSIDAANLNRMEAGIADTANAVNGLLGVKAKDLAPTATIESGADLDDITAPGSYSCAADASVTVENKPAGVDGAFLLYVYSVPGGGLTHELISADGRAWSRAVPGGWYEMSGPAMESFGELLWNGYIAEGGTLAIPRANEYGVMAVSYSDHAPVGLAMHYININGKHMISGSAGAAVSSGLASRGVSFESDDGVSWVLRDSVIVSQWKEGTGIVGSFTDQTTAKTLTVWGVVPSALTQRVPET